MTAVTHPVTGLPSQKVWLPTVKEVRDACEAAWEPIRQNELRLKRIQEQLEMRERMDRGEKPTLEQLQAKYGPNYGLDPKFGEGKERAVAGVNFSPEELERAAEQAKRDKVAFDQPLTHRAFEEPAQPEKWVRQSPSWDRITQAYQADPSRLDALVNTPFMNRKGKGPLKEDVE